MTTAAEMHPAPPKVSGGHKEHTTEDGRDVTAAFAPLSEWLEREIKRASQEMAQHLSDNDTEKGVQCLATIAALSGHMSALDIWRTQIKEDLKRPAIPEGLRSLFEKSGVPIAGMDINIESGVERATRGRRGHSRVTIQAGKVSSGRGGKKPDGAAAKKGAGRRENPRMTGMREYEPYLLRACASLSAEGTKPFKYGDAQKECIHLMEAMGVLKADDKEHTPSGPLRYVAQTNSLRQPLIGSGKAIKQEDGLYRITERGLAEAHRHAEEFPSPTPVQAGGEGGFAAEGAKAEPLEMAVA